ncbi:MAG: ankyrin repeat domain-containing protein [Proteobacteria bacterium]|nr:ankyrin repeat domain-containing protein [Pseudomonadota bacterium]
MLDITQYHLNKQLQHYCDQNLYSQVKLMKESEAEPKSFDRDTIMLQKQNRDLKAFWYENDVVKNKSLHHKDAKGILKIFKELNEAEKENVEEAQKIQKKLMKKVVSKYDCAANIKAGFLNDAGNCNGWSLLYAYYESIGKKEVFDHIRKYIANWDGGAFPKLDSTLREIYQDGEDLFKQVINDLVWFQASTLDVLYKDPTNKGAEVQPIDQVQKEKQFNMVTPGDEHLSDILWFGTPPVYTAREEIVKEEDFIDMMNLYNNWREGFVTFYIKILNTKKNSDENHFTSAFITDEGKFKYFDSNNRKLDQKELTAEQCLAAMKKEYKGDEIKVLGIYLHKFHEKDKDVLNEHEDFDLKEPEIKKLLALGVARGQSALVKLMKDEFKTSAQFKAFIDKNDIMNEVTPATDTDTLKILLDVKPDLSIQNAQGKTPVNLSIINGHFNKEVINLMPDAVNIQDSEGYSPLHLAVKQKNHAIIKTLIASSNINLDLRDKHGNTAIYYASNMPYADPDKIAIITELRKAGAKNDIANNAGKTPLDVVKEGNFDSVIQAINTPAGTKAQTQTQTQTQTLTTSGRAKPVLMHTKPNVDNAEKVKSVKQTVEGEKVKTAKETTEGEKVVKKPKKPSASH